MKKMTCKSFFFLPFLLLDLCLGQNVITNGDFETGSKTPWLGFNNQVLTDSQTLSLVGNVNNAEGSLYQVLELQPGKTYRVGFNYRWVSGSGNYNMNVRVKDENGPDVFGNIVLDTVPDVWHYGNFSFTTPAGISEVRLVFYKVNGNRPLRFDDVFVGDAMQFPSFVDPETPYNVLPPLPDKDWVLDFSDEFNGQVLDTTKWIVSVSSKSRAPRPKLGVNDWWWVQDHAFLDSTGHLILRATKEDNNTMYCGSIESRGIYETAFGYLEARIKIAETAKGNHTAFWLQGSNQSNINNSGADGAEVDIFESAWETDDTKAVVHFDGYGPQKKNHTIPYKTPGMHSGFHLFGLHWTADSMSIYYDGERVYSTNPNKPLPFTVDANGYDVVPQVPEWLWLSVGASFGDGDFQSQAVGLLSDAEVDYVRVFKKALPLGTGLIEERDDIRIYPNPTSNYVKIETEFPQFRLTIRDIQGRLVSDSKELGSTRIDLNMWEKGMYFFQLTHENTTANYQILAE